MLIKEVREDSVTQGRSKNDATHKGMGMGGLLKVNIEIDFNLTSVCTESFLFAVHE